MNNKEFITALSAHMGISAKETQQLTQAFTNHLAEKLEEGRTLSIQGFGNFEVKKKMERVVVKPGTKQRMLVPPKLALSFKPSNTLKDKFK